MHSLCVLLLFFGTALGANDVRVVITPDPFTAERPVPFLLKQSGPGQLRCAVENKDQESKVRWQKCRQDGSQCNPVSTGVNIYDDTRYAVKFEPPQVWVLLIKNVQMETEGVYKCYVNLKSASDSTVSASVQVKVYDKPYILRLNSDTEVTRQEEKDASLKCNATGIPTPSITWTRAGNAIMPGGGLKTPGAVLYIAKVRPQHRGDYFCQASNLKGSDKIRVVLKIQFKPVVKPFSEIMSQKPGYRIILSCNVEAYPEVVEADTFWKYKPDRLSIDVPIKNVKFIRKSHNEATMKLTISNVKTSDYGFYTCGAENRHGRSSNVIELKYSDKPERDLIGQVIAAGVCLKSNLLILSTISVLFMYLL